MTEPGEEQGGTRESPMASNGGLAASDPHPFIPVTGDGSGAVYDGLPGYPPGREGRTYKVRHPPIDCPNPRIMSTALGWYRCPCCGAKIRHSSHVSGRESGYTAADTIGWAVCDGIRWAWEIAWPSLKTLIIWAARAIKWAVLHGIPDRKEDNTDAIVVTDRQPDRPGAQSQIQVAAQGHEETADQEPAPEEAPRVLACTTSDGQHVYQHQDGQLQCHVCGPAAAGKD